ncbi:SMP-30/gluconolactonase/LRE family protein [Pseudoduganella rivuli]|uniref:SMP-30/gluconolactonase/LRE family protein n=1 Tax=Pseudoduganella rivuli TaxID=2666085 RepID=UPI0018A20C91
MASSVRNARVAPAGADEVHDNGAVTLLASGHVESLRWHHGQWWWCDPDSASIYTWQEQYGEAPVKPSRTRLPDRAAALAFCHSGRVLLAQAKWLCFADRATPPAQGLGRRPPQPGVAVDPAEPRTGISDGAADRDGHFVFGTRNVTPEARQIGSYYQYSTAHGLRRLALPAAAMAHSIAVSPDGGTLYFSDAATRRIMQCDYDSAAAKVANVRLFAEVEQAQPRGAVIDADGCLWSAHFGAGKVARYAADGRLLRSIELPAKYPTQPAFGGPQFEHLLVGAMPQPGAAGGLYRLDAGGARGLPGALFKDR